MSELSNIHADIASRVAAITAAHPDWPCRKSCDACCHHLAEVPRLTRPEWELLRDGLAALPAPLLADIGRAMADLGTVRPIVCPLLDRATGECRVYAFRPVACRTYGFYMQRGVGVYCREIEARVAAGAWPDVVWGNQDVVEGRLAALGEVRELPAWFAENSKQN